MNKGHLLLKSSIFTIMAFASTAQAATITIDTLDGGAGALDVLQLDTAGNPTLPTVTIAGTNDGKCSLAEAIEAANTDTAVDSCTAGAGDDDIVFGISGTVNLVKMMNPLNYQLRAKINKSLTLQGHANGTILDATLAKGSALRISDAINVTISDIEIKNAGSTDTYNYGSSFAAINILFSSPQNLDFPTETLNISAVITLENLHIHDNVDGGIGYAKAFSNTRNVKVLIKDSLIENNTASTGAGISMDECVAGFLVSDRRLKKDISLMGKSPSGIPKYSFRYKDGFSPYGKNDKRLFKGVMAQDLLKLRPSAVSIANNGFYHVDYSKTDVGFSLLDQPANANKAITQQKSINKHYTLEVINSLIKNNHAVFASYPDGNGGTILVADSGSGGGVTNNCGHLKVTNTTVSGNTAEASGAGVFIAQGQVAVDYTIFPNPPTSYYQTLTELYNTTVSGNTAEEEGGGIILAHADTDHFTPELIINHNTIAGNNGGNGGHGILIEGGTVKISNTVIADNTAEDQCMLNGALAENIGNASSDESCTFTNQNITAGLSPLVDNGGIAPLGPNGAMGNVFTMAIDVTSPLFDTANTAKCLATDERGIARPIGAACDIGAFEAPIGTLAIAKTITTAGPYTPEQTVEYQIAVTSSGGGLMDITVKDKSKNLNNVSIIGVTGNAGDTGSCNNANPSFPCTIADLADGEMVTFTISGTIN